MVGVKLLLLLLGRFVLVRVGGMGYSCVLWVCLRSLALCSVGLASHTCVCRLETPTVAYRRLAVLFATPMPLVVRGVEDEKTTVITCGPSYMEKS